MLYTLLKQNIIRVYLILLSVFLKINSIITYIYIRINYNMAEIEPYSFHIILVDILIIYGLMDCATYKIRFFCSDFFSVASLMASIFACLLVVFGALILGRLIILLDKCK